MVLVEIDNHQTWNAFVSSSQQGSVYATTWYHEAIGMDHKMLAVKNNDGIIAGTILAYRSGNWGSGPLQKYTGILFGKIWWEDFHTSERY